MKEAEGSLVNIRDTSAFCIDRRILMHCDRLGNTIMSHRSFVRENEHFPRNPHRFCF